MSRNLPEVVATREAIAAAPVHGNAWQDGPLMNAIDRFVRNPANSTADKLWALDKLSNDIMGLDEPPCTTEDLNAYLSEAI